MIPCSMRGVECSCDPSECRSAPPKPIAHAIIPTWRDQFAVCVFFGVVTGIAFFGVMASQEGYQKITDLINQENVSWN